MAAEGAPRRLGMVLRGRLDPVAPGVAATPEATGP
jgi:hypothetical protein